ncbi:uncharacterized protein OsI_027940-like [Durio zibethinus]|uniref:Co-chaperone protein p23 n=1 Tax=Durio zibethinus TaxID=66656 RepID=A0A6P6B5M6_DURZI|nr:uncharacterized protein OsI_027940-like [Durio zibethinus]
MKGRSDNYVLGLLVFFSLGWKLQGDDKHKKGRATIEDSDSRGPCCGQNFSLVGRTAMMFLQERNRNQKSQYSNWHPTVKWAQMSDVVFITFELPDAQDVKLKQEPVGKFFFPDTIGVDKIPYEVDMALHDQIVVDESKASVGKRNICYLVKKAENKWWSRLLKQEGKPPVFWKVDWDRWVDEGEEDQDNAIALDMNFGDFDFSKLNMGGGEGFCAAEGEDDDDSDTEEENVEELPPLKKD